jgi:hypothetical protein
LFNVLCWYRAAQTVVEQIVKDGMTLGLGSGSLGAAVIECLAAERAEGMLKVGVHAEQKARVENVWWTNAFAWLQRIQCIPATDTAAVEAAIHGLPLSDLAQHIQVKTSA